MSIKKKIEDLWTAVTLAEANLDPASVPSLGWKRMEADARTRLEDLFSAAALAEAGLADAARRLVLGREAAPGRDLSGFLADVGLAGVRVRYCVVQV
ncbi:MAG: hypothetical protein H5U10_16045 [Desulfacinum sp.]|nr:hypothetical protein [Desulfacinum sp.]